MSEVKVKVSLLSEIQTGLAKVKAQFGQFRSELNSQFANFVAFGSIVAGIRAIIANGDQLANVAHRFAAPIEDLQRVAIAAKENGASIEDVARAWNFLEKNRQKARDGNDEMRKHFQDLGISMKEVINLPVDQLFYRVADATRDADDRGRAYAATVSLMGRGAGVLYSTLEKGSAGIKEASSNVEVLSSKSVERLHQLSIEVEHAMNFVKKYGSEALLFVLAIPKALGEAWGITFNMIGRGWENLTNALDSAVHGHFIEAGKMLAHGIGDQFKDTAQEVKAAWKDITMPFDAPKPKGPVDEEATATKNEQASIDKITTLRAQLADMQRKAANEQLATEEKITAMVQQRAALLKEASGERDEEKKLGLQIDAQKITDEIEKTRASHQKEIEDAEDRLDKATRDREYGELRTDAQRRRFLQDEIEGLNKMIAAEDDAAKKLDFETKREDDYKKLEGLTNRSGITVVADSLARIGGGGGKAVTGGADAALHEARTHTSLLKQIVINTKPSEGENELKLK